MPSRPQRRDDRDQRQRAVRADVWWLLFGADDRIAVAFPQGASGEQEAIDWLIALPGFDHEAMIMAMGSTGNAVFPVWRRAP